MDDRVWRTSSYSGGQGNCVEVAARGHGNRVLVRDSKDARNPTLAFDPRDWRQFTDRLKEGV